MQLMPSVAPTKALTRRAHGLRRKIEGTILLNAANEGTEIDEAEVKRRVFLEEATKRVRLPPVGFAPLVLFANDRLIDLYCVKEGNRPDRKVRVGPRPGRGEQ